MFHFIIAQDHTQFSSGCDFIMGLGKPKLCTKFEVASFSHSINIEGEPPNLGSSLSQAPRPLFLLRVICYAPWQTPAVCKI